MGSTRLPGKSMLPLAGRPLVYRIIERLKRCSKVDSLVLAVPNTVENEILVQLAKENNVEYFCGSENNLIDRFYNAAISVDADYVVRFPADNPVPEPKEIDNLIIFHLENNKEGFSSNICSFFHSGYPDGIGAEIFSMKLLKDVFQKLTTDEQKEHLHLNFFNYKNSEPVDPNWCPVKTFNCPKSFRRPELILDVNTIEQYNFLKELYDSLYTKNSNFGIEDIIDWYDNQYSKKIDG